ncbi:trans-aconitate methyltransferase [Catalinimonas alkaloidigena]|uniref:class I SAM-dependent methyltransferase n=1 Tax=Catalinimonas alkaloidigena TaxID=1075417 RepID=UPI002405A9F8|nr:class I SAM-dependent methyltransferase [Catalinimonas alkaloidigena]MDF9795968.1 trans-aconitate methyltransferase [Catalinimonas alkaloidigena]
MKISDAINLIRDAEIDHSNPSIWADLGCGSGTFTLALAHLLAEGSTVYAIDKQSQRISKPDHEVNIVFRQADFERDALNLSPLDGLLMANALHYMEDKEALLSRLLQYIRPGGKLLLVEYDTLRANPWVPYPIDFQHMESLLQLLGMERVVKLGERRSLYNGSQMYACLAEKGK